MNVFISGLRLKLGFLYSHGFAISLILICTCYVHSSGQTKQFKFKHLNNSDGLSHHEITTIFKDSRGYIWIGTTFGLNRFDGYMVKSFLHDEHDSTSLIDNTILRLFETPDRMIGVLTCLGLTLFNPEYEKFEQDVDRFYAKYGTSKQLTNILHDVDGSFWFVESDKVIRYLPENKSRIVFTNVSNDSASIVNDPVSDFSIGRNGDRWIVHTNGIAEKVTVVGDRGQVVKRVDALYTYNRHQQSNYQILPDSDGDLWFFSTKRLEGIFYYNSRNNVFSQITSGSPGMHLNTNSISSFAEVKNGQIWVGTDHGGINVVDKKNLTVRYILQRDEDIRSLSENSVKCLYQDDQGIIWVGTYKRGVSYYHDHIYRFDVYKHYSLDPASLPFEDINRFAEDSKGNLWIGTNGGGLLYFDRQAGRFKQYKNEPGNRNSLSGDVIVSLCMDSDQNLWIGTYKEGLNKFDGKNFVRFYPVPGDTTSLPSSNVWELFEDSRKQLWIGTLDAGVALYDKTTGKFSRARMYGPNAIQSVTIDAITEDRYGRMWFGTTTGIDVLSSDGKKFTHYTSSNNYHSLSNDNILDILEDSRGRIWIGTMDGLNLFDESVNGFRVYKDQLPHHAVLTIREDNLGRIWMGTLNGLSELTLPDNNPENVSFKHYTESDGLQGLQFNLNAAFKTSKGELVFGGPTGFNIFRVKKRTENLQEPRVVFSDLQLYQKSVNIGEKIDGVAVLTKSVSEVNEITLPPNKSFFSIKFTALDYFNPEKNEYWYKLEGLNSEWLRADSKNHEISFSNLHPGHYKLRVRAVSNMIHSRKDTVLDIIILPPFWKTNIAFIFYTLVLVFILIVARRLIQQREQLKFALEQERREIQRVHELDVMKVKFFTNVSHEFRTPLTLILAPIDRLLREVKDVAQQAHLQLIQRNGKRLLNLVNQLLDFKKLEVQEVRFSPSEGDIIAFLKDTVLSFSDLSEKNNIKLEWKTSVEHVEMMFDQDKLEKIVFNLLSNAFKFTPGNGTVSVSVDRMDNDANSFLRINVCDTGIGIPVDKQDKIFEPFFQNDLPRSVVNQGSGIGLAITKEFVRIHGGHLEVKSEVGKGSCFTVLLPLKEIVSPITESQAGSDVEVLKETNQEIAENQHSIEEVVANQGSAGKRKTLLLVEDNDDFRFYLKDNLRFSYTIYEARNGAEGWKQVLALEPDLVISDIMMPEMNGIDLCTKIKSDERVSHIPVILLTARSSKEQQLEGFQTGADDYITKPFNFEILESRIANLLLQREKIRKTFGRPLDVKASKLQITPLDVKFVENAIKCVEANISSPEFSVEDLGMELAISRAYLYKKLLALTGKSPLEFIRTIRLQHAAQLLEKSQLSVREVAYKVGFNNPKYFTKYFKEQFNVLPSNYAASLQKKE